MNFDGEVLAVGYMGARVDENMVFPWVSRLLRGVRGGDSGIERGDIWVRRILMREC